MAVKTAETGDGRPLAEGAGHWRRYALVLVVYVLATFLSDAHFMADTEDYVRVVVDHCNGAPRVWDSGHLLWQPVGYMAFRAFRPLIQALVGPDLRTGVTWTLIALVWLAGLVSVLSLRGLLGCICGRGWVADVVTVAFIFSHAFLNFAQSGTSYVVGLAPLMLGMFILARAGVREEPSWPSAIAAGACLAAAICAWFPYILAIPAAVLSPLFLQAVDRKRGMMALQAAVASGLFAGLTYGLALVDLGIFSLTGARQWLLTSTHGTETRGLARMVFGLARSFITMGDYGMLFKRFLLHDPFNPVSVSTLLRVSLWKLAFFYLFLMSMAIGLMGTRQGRRALALLAVAAAPVLAFAVRFDGGAIERYLPFFPFVFVALGCSLCLPRLGPVGVLILAFVAVASVANGSAMQRSRLARGQEASAARMRSIVARSKPMSRIFAVNWQDDLVNFHRSFPLHEVNQRPDLRVTSLVTPGTAQAAQWRSEFAGLALETWRQGGDVWISGRAFTARPRPEWNWVEGTDPQVKWPDFEKFFSQLEIGETADGEDGFALLPPTPGNERFLRRLMDDRRAAPSPLVSAEVSRPQAR
jgi:hypothetical protein